MKDVIHEVQTEHSLMRKYVTGTILNGTFEWRNLTPKRNPQARQNVVPDLAPRTQSFSTFGITVHPYDDDVWLPPETVKNSRIMFEAEVAKAMEMGFERLYDKIAFSSMLVGVRKRTTSAWKTGEVSTSVDQLEDTRIGGRVTGSGGSAALAEPTFKTLIQVRLKFTQNNVSDAVKIYAAMTPNMERILYDMVQFYNKDYIFAKESDNRMKVLPFAGFHWVRVTPEVSPGAFYASKFLTNTAASELADAAASGVDLTPTNHEVIPFWVKSNVYVGECPQLDLFAIFTVPYKRLTPIMVRTKWLGASRAQNILQYNLIVPTA